MSQTPNATDATFEAEDPKADKPVLVDLSAPWCGPCRQVARILEEMAAEYADKIKIVKVNTDENPQIAASYGITSIPTMNVFLGGELVKTIVGARLKVTLTKELAEFL